MAKRFRVDPLLSSEAFIEAYSIGHPLLALRYIHRDLLPYREHLTWEWCQRVRGYLSNISLPDDLRESLTQLSFREQGNVHLKDEKWIAFHQLLLKIHEWLEKEEEEQIDSHISTPSETLTTSV